MTRKLKDSVTWLSRCIELDDNDRHLHVSMYLIQGEDGNVFVDIGSPYHEDEVKKEIEKTLGDEGIDTIILTHSDRPHSGNAEFFQKNWNDVEPVASSAIPHLSGLPRGATKCEIGEDIEFGGRRLRFIDPPLGDRNNSVWVYDYASGVLFTSDGFGNQHLSSECESFSTEIDGGLRTKDIRAYHATALRWLPLADPSVLIEDLQDLLNSFKISYIAPGHGNPIPHRDIDPYMNRFAEAIEDIATSPASNLHATSD